MTKEQIARIINPKYPSVYAPTTEPTKLVFEDGSIKVGFFQLSPKSDDLELLNKYTFVEFGEKAQKYRATNDQKYLTIVDGKNLINVEYPSYSDALIENLKIFKEMKEKKNEVDWEKYKKQWTNAISSFQKTIMFKWFSNYEETGLMSFAIIPIKRIEPFLNEYLTTMLEITLANNVIIVFEPLAGVTSSYNGEISFYQRGNVSKKYSIFRDISGSNRNNWILAKSQILSEHILVNKVLIESIIFKWLQ